MERDEVDKTHAVGITDDIESRSAVNSTILNYYKKFGRKRDLEQYFSLSTAQSDIKDTSGVFWRKMKSENDSSDSGDRRSESSQEVCRISIRCSLPEVSSSQDDEEPKAKIDSPQTESPPIIIEEVPADVSRHTDEESINFEDNNSQKSFDIQLDLSTHKPHSPTSSITSQRKLEWDSLADVGYGNESDRKNSASSLSTLERLALKQQYSNNDTKQDIGPPTSHSTPLDEDGSKSKPKKGLGKKTTKIYKKDVDFVEVNVPHTSDVNQTPSINVNLTKHISFNVERDGAVTVDNIKKDVSISPEKVSVETEAIPYLGMDKEIQTSLTKEKTFKDKSSSIDEIPKTVNPYNQKIPVMISLNTLRKRLRRKKSRNFRRKMRTKKLVHLNKEVTPQEKSGEQLSEAESFEYMPGHMYNQNQLKAKETRPDNSTAGNKSSLESSGPLTTDSSKGSKHSLTKDLEKCVDLLKVTLQNRYDDSNTKKRLIKDIVHRLVSSKYRDDETTTEFLSGLSFNSKKLGIKGNNTTTSTSDANNTEDSSNKKPKKSILRNDKFNPNVVASTSQSAPNLFSGSSEKINTNLIKTITSHTESDVSSREKTFSDNAFPKTSSEQLYLKYLEALRREEAYKRHLKEKELFLKQKLVSSETAFKVPIRQEPKVNSRLKDLMKDLTRNNYDDGSGDASKLEGGSSSNIDFQRLNSIRNQRSHSVFTLSSSHSDGQKRQNLKKKMQTEREIDEAGPSRSHYCCCPHHNLNSKVGYTDSSVQVNIKCHQCEDVPHEKQPCQTKPKGCVIMPCETKKDKIESPRKTRVVPDSATGEIKYVCLCNGKQVSSSDVGDNFMIYKCSRLTNRGVQLEDPGRSNNAGVQCGGICKHVTNDKIELIQPPCQMNPATDSSSSDYTSNVRRHSKSSQTNMVVNMCLEMNKCPASCFENKNLRGTAKKCIMGLNNPKKVNMVHEATRCLQTEISINPQIADPTLSDINIISNCDCAKLISEEYKKIPLHKSDSEESKTFSDVCTNSTQEKLLIQSEGSVYGEVGKDTRKEQETGPRYAHSAMAIGKDITVPIKGTNMTLTVNLGGPEVTNRAEQVDQSVVTEKIPITDVATATSAIEKSKSAHCSYTTCCINCNNKMFSNETSASTRKPCLSKKFSTEVGPNYFTYPKTDVIKEKAPLKRSNTDTEKLSICTCMQTELIKTKDAETNNNQSIIVCGNQTSREFPTFEKGSLVHKSVDSGLARKEEESVEEKESFETNSIKSIKDGIRNKKMNLQMKTYSTTSNEKEDSNNTDPIIVRMKTDTTKSNKKEDSVKTEGISIGIQKDLPYEEELYNYIMKNPEIKTRKIEIERSDMKAVGIETESGKKTDRGYGVGCQTDTLPKNDPEEELTHTFSTVNISKDTVKQPVTCCYKVCCPANLAKGPVLDMIQDITRRYSKTDMVKIKKKKCFSEIMAVLNYLLETEDSTDPEPKTRCSTSTESKLSSNKTKRSKPSDVETSDRTEDKNVPLPLKKSSKNNQVAAESSDLPGSSDLPTTSTDSAACKVLNKIKKECEKYHQKIKCKGRKCEVSSSTSMNCERCNKVHHCACRSHKCKRSKTFEKLQKKCIAYNLIIQTSESMLSEERVCEKKGHPLKNIIVKVPKRKGHVKNEGTFKAEHVSPRSNSQPSPRSKNRSRSCPDESETSDEYAKRVELATVREYLEQNRPDFVENSSQRQSCLKFISERRSSERSAKRDLLSLHLEKQPDLTNLSSDDLRQLAKEIGLDLRRKKTAPKFISEREMKKHSEKIYKTLPEVVQKKEEKKKENIKKTNLLMANMFKKNLQKQALRGSVNLSNYSTVIKI